MSHEMMKEGYTSTWLSYVPVGRSENTEFFRTIVCPDPTHPILKNAIDELETGAGGMYDIRPAVTDQVPENGGWIELAVDPTLDTVREGYALRSDGRGLKITGKEPVGVLYGVFEALRRAATKKSLSNLDKTVRPSARWRILNHWDVAWPMRMENTGGGWPNGSLFFDHGKILVNERTRDYMRMLASVGINGAAIHNVNVFGDALDMITPRFYDRLTELSTVFAGYGVGLIISLNFASPVLIGGLETADPSDPRVQQWWADTMDALYAHVPNIAGFVVKADSEGVQGPFDYGRNQADGANVVARAVKPHGGVVFWRCFVYNCQQDWRDHSIDRAKSGYENFQPLDGQFDDNVILQIKNGPQDFQVREPAHPLFGSMKNTNQMIEFQILQEYTGGRNHICFLIPQFKETLGFNTHALDRDNTVADIVSGKTFNNYDVSGCCAVANADVSMNWCGHDLACANLYGYGRMTFDMDATSEEIANDFILQSYGNVPEVVDNVKHILLNSWPTYEKYNAPLGLGWLCNNGAHYGPNPDCYEYDRWGTYHRANWEAVGIDRTDRGTGFTEEYNEPNRSRFNSLETCPEELALFFFRLRYDYVLKSGKTLLQHIYDTHFEGVEDVKDFIRRWESLRGKIFDGVWERVRAKLDIQLEHAEQWRDVINTYFYRRTGIPDAQGRTIYE